MKKELWDVCQEIKSHEKVIPVCNDRDANWACNQKLFKIDVAYIMGRSVFINLANINYFAKALSLMFGWVLNKPVGCAILVQCCEGITK